LTTIEMRQTILSTWKQWLWQNSILFGIAQWCATALCLCVSVD